MIWTGTKRPPRLHVGGLDDLTGMADPAVAEFTHDGVHSRAEFHADRDGGGGTGGGTGGGAGAGGGTGAQPSYLNEMTRYRARRFIERHGNDAERAVAALFAENHSYRRTLRREQGAAPETQSVLQENADLVAENVRLRDQLQAAQGRVPQDGAVLTADEKKLYDAVKALGLSSDEIVARVNGFPDLALAQTAEAVSKALGWNPGLTRTTLKAEGLVVDFRETEVEGEDGKKVKKPLPYARKAGEAADKGVLLTEYAAKHLHDVLPALKSAPHATSDGTTSHGETPTTGIEFPTQDRAQGTAPTSDPVAAFMARAEQERSAAPSPFAPPATKK